MIAAVCAEEFVARPSYMGCRNYDYGDLCGIGEKKGIEGLEGIPTYEAEIITVYRNFRKFWLVI